MYHWVHYLPAISQSMMHDQSSRPLQDIGCEQFLSQPRKCFASLSSSFSSVATGVYVSAPGPSQLRLLQSQAEPLQHRAEPPSSQEQAELSATQMLAPFSGRGQSRTSLLNPHAVSATSPYKHMQSLDESQHSASGNTMEGLSFILDNGDKFEDGDTLRAFNTISQVCSHALLAHLQMRTLPAIEASLYQHSSAQAMLCTLCTNNHKLASLL